MIAVLSEMDENGWMDGNGWKTLVWFGQIDDAFGLWLEMIAAVRAVYLAEHYVPKRK
jgi:hypothetical protein